MFSSRVSIPLPRLPSFTNSKSSLNIRVAAPDAGTNFHNGQSGGGPLVTFGGGSGLGVAQRQHAVAG